MKFNITYFRWTLVLTAIVLVLFSCKEDEIDRPLLLEEIQFEVPDSSTIIRAAGTTVDFSLSLTTDNAIDTLRAGYIIDTLGIHQNIEFEDMDTIVLTTGFVSESNIQQYSGSIMLPTDAYGVRPFRAYNPSFPDTADVVRIVFRLEAGFDVYEKQMKVIIE